MGLQVALVGPSSPYKGGVVAHTTALAHQLTRAGHHTTVVSWRHLYPRLLYPGEVTSPEEDPDVEEFEPTTRTLSWARPDTWWRTGRQLRDVDVIVIVHVVPALIPAHLAVMRAARRGPRAPRIVALVHNVLPHEKRTGDTALVRRLLSSVDAVLVHSEQERTQAEELSAAPVSVAVLPPHFPGGAPQPRAPREGLVRLLALGIVRDYKGIDLVVRALREVPNLSLTIAGEHWGAAGERVKALATDPLVSDRVTLIPEYVPSSDIAPLIASHEAMILAYRSATGSQNVLLAHHHGLPVLVTDVGALSAGVRDGVDGLVIQPQDHDALVRALRRLADRAELERLRLGVVAPDVDGPWDTYVDVLLGSTATPDSELHADRGCSTLSTPRSGQVPDPPGGRLLGIAKRGAELALWTRVTAQRRLESRLGRPPRTLPGSVLPTGVLRTESEWRRAVDEALALRLPLHHDMPKNWDALGAVGAVLSMSTCSGGSATRVLDAGSARYSSVLPWLRLFGLGEGRGDLVGINLEFDHTVYRDGVCFRFGDVTATDFADGSFDAVTCMSVIEHGVPVSAFLSECARILRPGGLCIVSTDFDRLPPDTTGLTAYGSPVKIFGPLEIRELVEAAALVGLELVGDLDEPGFFEHSERPVRWKRTGLQYTFILLTFRRVSTP